MGARARPAVVRALCWLCVLAGGFASASGGNATRAFEFPLRGREAARESAAAGRVYADVERLVEDKFADIEERWRWALPIAGGDVSPPVSEWAAVGRGQYAERRDYTLNRQPGAPALGGPRSDSRADFPIDGAKGGNFCDEGSADTRCIVHRQLLLPSANGSFTLSGQGRTPFARSAACSCRRLGCACSVEIGDFLPEFADLSWARVSVEVERGGVQVDGADALVKSIRVDGSLLQGQCNPPRLCAPGAPSESLTIAGPAVCDPVCGEWHACLPSRDVSSLAADGHLAVTVESGNWQFVGGNCDGNILHVRVRMEGEYTGQGTLEVRAGGGIFCTHPNCTITIRDFRTVSFHQGSLVATDSLVVRVPHVYIGGVVEANRVHIAAGALNVSAGAALVTDDTRRHSRADLDIRPGNLPHDAKFLPAGCHDNCLPCTCLTVDGLVSFTRIVITGLSLQLGTSGHLSSDALGHLAAHGPGAGNSSALGGGGAGFGGRGSSACASGSAAGGVAYGAAVAPNDVGYCAGRSRQAAIATACSNAWELELGSGGGHGKVEGGQGGGAIRIHTDVEAVIHGRVSADGEHSACTQVQAEGPILDRWDQRPVPGDITPETPLVDKTSGHYTYLLPQSGGGGGSGGSIWIISPRVTGRGVISAVGGSANRSCHTVSAVTSGGGGGGGRIALDYAVSSADLRVVAHGGTSLCTAAGAGTHFDAHRQLVLLDNGGIAGARMAGDLAASFAALANQPTITAAFTPWTGVQGLEGEALRRRACAWKADDALPFGCILDVNASLPRLVVRAGAVAEIPTETLKQVLVTRGGAMLITNRSLALRAHGDIMVEDEGVLGCLGCAGSFEALNGMPGCNDTCPAWQASSTNGSITIKGGAQVMGVSVRLEVVSGELKVAHDSAVLASDWHTLSTLEMLSKAGDIKIEGRLHFSKVTLDGANDVLVGASGWIGTDALGQFGGSGPGAGGMSSLGDGLGGGGGGGGGGHGGRGAEGCADFAAGGKSYGDVTVPHEYGSGGGAGGGTNVSVVTAGTAAAGGEAMLALLSETRGAPLDREPLTSVMPDAWEVREVERGPSGVRVTESACVLRGTRSYLFDRAHQPDPDPTRLLSRHGSACPAGYRGSSLRNWCCRGGWGAGVGAGVGGHWGTNETVGGCDCALVTPGLFAGGRGGGVVRIRTDGRVKHFGRVSARGESTYCQGDTRTHLARRQSFALGGGGAGGSLSIEALTIEGDGSVIASGGDVIADCADTRSGGGGAGGRVALVTTERESTRRAVEDRLDVDASGGSSDGCAAGAAGTIWVAWNGTLLVDNRRGITNGGMYSGVMPSAPTPFPSRGTVAAVTGGGGGNGGAWRWNSSELDVVVQGGATLLWGAEDGGKPPVPVRHLWLTDRSFVGAAANTDNAAASVISVHSVTVSSGAVLGCLQCAASVDVQNGLPGCSSRGADSSGEARPPQRGIVACPATAVAAADYLRVVSGGKVLGVSLNVTAGQQLVVDATGTISTADYLAASDLLIQSPYIRIAGLLHSSTIQVVGARVLVAQTGEVSGEAMGSGGALGPSAGASHRMGGGGGGHGGRGAQGCYLAAEGGDAFVSDDVASPWRFGSGGGHGGGNSRARGGRGGGRIKVVAHNLTVDGRVTVDGASTVCAGAVRTFYSGNRADKEFLAGAHSGGAGAGGSIWIDAHRVFGAGGLHARGGSTRGSCHLAWPGGGGGGGRIAILVAQQEKVDLAAFAGGGGSGFSVEQADGSATGGRKGCAAGGAGTVYVQTSTRRSLIIDNGLARRLSALTPFPTQYAGEGDGAEAATDPQPLFDLVWARRGALLEFPRAPNASAPAAASFVLGRRAASLMRVSDGAAILAVRGGQILNATTLEVGDGGLVGAMTCSDSGEVQNGVLGCSSECVSVSVLAATATVFAGGRIQGCSVDLAVDNLLEVQDAGALLGVRTVSESILRATVNNASIHGLVRFSTVDVNASASVTVWDSGMISSSGLGHPGDTGPGAGTASVLGGGGGAHVGRGSDACTKSVTGAVLGAGGTSYGQWKGAGVDEGWLLGSGGGHGRSTWSARALDNYQHIPAYPRGGYQACEFDRACADDDRESSWNRPERRPNSHHLMHHPVYEVVRMLEGVSPERPQLLREGRGSARIRSNDSLCFPRGHAVDHWEGVLHLPSASVPPHPRACAPGWKGSASMPDFCCQPSRPSSTHPGGNKHKTHQDGLLASWRVNDLEEECDCSPYVIGSNPGGRGGGRVRLSAGQQLVLAGHVNVDGEGTLAYGQSGDPGGAGAGGSIALAAPFVKGSGVVSAEGGASIAGAAGSDAGYSAGGAGGGGRVALRHALLASSLSVSVAGGRTDCRDSRIARYCDAVYQGQCKYKVMSDEFDMFKLGNPFWEWDNAPPGVCTVQVPAELSAAQRQRLLNSNPKQGHCWDVGLSQLGWLRMYPKHNISFFMDDSAHRLHIPLPGDVAFDVETRVIVTNNDSSCVHGGLYVGGRLKGGMHNSLSGQDAAAPKPKDLDEWVSIAVLDHGDDARLQWSTRGTPMEEVFGIRDRAHATHMYMRLVRDNNGTVSGYWRQDNLKPWTLLAPPIHWEWETLEVGLFSAQCALYGNATVDFDYLRDSGARNFQRTFGEAAACGIVSEEGLPPGGWGMLGGVGGSVGTLNGANALNQAVAAASGDEVVKVFDLHHGSFQTGGLSGGLQAGAAEHVVLRGNLTNLDLSKAWNNVSSAHFVTSRRYSESLHDVTDGMMWNGTAWVPAATVFNVSLRPNLAKTRYVFFIDGVERPTLTLLRPSSFRDPNIYVFTLDAHSVSKSNLSAVNETLVTSLPTLQEQEAERRRQGAGLTTPHAFVIKTVDTPGLEMQYTLGTRNNGASSGQVELRVWPGAPDLLYYESSLLPDMGGVIKVEEPLLGHNKLIRSRRLLEAKQEAEWGRVVRRGRGHADMEAEEQVSPRESFRLRLEAFYSKYNSEKLAHLEDMVDAWSSKEEQLNGMLIAKYGVGLPAEGVHEDVWLEGEEDPQEIEGKRRAFAARGSLKVDDGPQGWMGSGAHGGGRSRVTPRVPPSPPPPTSSQSPSAPDMTTAASEHVDAATIPPTTTSPISPGSTTTPPPSPAEATPTPTPVSSPPPVQGDGEVDSARVRSRAGAGRDSGVHDDEAEAEEARWRERDRAYVEQQREGALRMKQHVGTKGRELDTEYTPHLNAARAAPLPGQSEITVLPGGIGDAAALKLPIVTQDKLALSHETTIVSPGKVVIDCQGGPFFAGGGSGAQLHLVDMHVDLVACSFPAPRTPSPGSAPEAGGGKGDAVAYHRHAITVQRSIVRFIRCNFTGGSGGGAGGGVDVDTSYLDFRKSSFKGIKAPTAATPRGADGGADGVWGAREQEGGGAVRMGVPSWHVGGGFVSAARQRSIHRRGPQVYMATTLMEKNVAQHAGGIAVARGTFYCQDCIFLSNVARESGGAVQIKTHGAAIISHSSFSRNSARVGGAMHLAGGSTLLSYVALSNNAAREKGGALLFRAPTLPYTLAKQVPPKGEEALYAVVPPATATMLHCSLENNMAIGSATEAAVGGGIYFDGSGSASLERSHVSSNSVMGPDAEGGCFAIRDGGVLYLRDSVVSNNSAAYGAVLRVHTQRKGDVSVLFNNVTIANNSALRYGGIVSGYSHAHAMVVPFTFAGGRYFYDIDSYAALSRPLLRFGFNADPYLDPKSANIAPQGTGIIANNPYEPGWHTLELPLDPHLTDQWPFFATGSRHKGYFDVRTTPGQKAASGGVALLLQDANPLHFSTPDKEALSGAIAFKDSNIYDNSPRGLSCCYFHADIASQRCLSDYELL